MSEQQPEPASDDSATQGVEPSAVARNPLLAALVPGVVIDDKYRIDRVIGRGAMGLVVAATHLQLGEPVALKFLLTRAEDEADREAASMRFRREARVSARLRNEHIARVLDVGVLESGALYMVMELLHGAEIGALLAEQGTFATEVAVDYVVQVCEGLAEAHGRGIVHRDLKPSNLFVVARADGTPLVKILDFGVSKWAGLGDTDDALTEAGAVLGTPKYMAPEQLFAADTVDARADVWSIGAILFTMMTGRAPFNEPSFAKLCGELASGKPPPRLRELLPDAPEAIDEVIARCLRSERDDRFANVAELAHALLVAVGAPWAEPTRARLSAILAGVSAGSTGEFAAARTGAFLAAPASGRMKLAPPSLATPTAQSLDGAAAPATRKRGSAAVWVGLLAIGLGVGAVLAIRPAVFFGARGQASAEPTTTLAPAAAPSAARSAGVVAAPSTSASPSPSATVAPSAVVAAPSVSATAPAVTTSKPIWRPPPRPDPTAAKPPPVTKPTGNPLDERM